MLLMLMFLTVAQYISITIPFSIMIQMPFPDFILIYSNIYYDYLHFEHYKKFYFKSKLAAKGWFFFLQYVFTLL